MRPIPNLENIALPQIEFDNFSYSVSPEQHGVPDESLSKSIARYGVLHPPIVRENNSGRYNIVAGRKILLALRSLHAARSCACLVLPRQTAEVDVFDILLEAMQLSRQLTTVEKAIFLQKITAVTDEEHIIRKFLPRLGLAPDVFSIKKILKLFDLEEPILQGLHRGLIHEMVAHDFILLSPEDRMALFEIITAMRLSVSYQKKLLHICSELASRGNISIVSLLDNDAVQSILQHQDANPPQKTKNLMLWLYRRHMPRAQQAEEEFNRFISALQLPQNVSIGHTPFFEDDAMTLAVTFPNRKSLHEAWKKIRHATDSTDN